MGLLHKFIPPNDRYAALMLYGMVFSTCFNGYDAGIMVRKVLSRLHPCFSFMETSSGALLICSHNLPMGFQCLFFNRQLY